ncbi:hypothetical protein DM01DRAFT_1337718 [Hesseltinella vesiculosa]|uniref:SAP domain-containing protein n=1 Tax=Hesseltinella vesiculosa TaxID=101127 RepID=A0A1X2GCE3_9FUNG|nr:hypothetical protein DM01DRAFT_1337718 [Hesseltinella vesiculosa]
MKKSKLIALAKEQQLDVDGTKNDLIDRLLADEPSDDPEPPASLPLDQEAGESEDMDLTEELQDKPEQSPKEETPAPTVMDTIDPEIDSNENELDQAWVEAFDLKVNNRGTTGIGGLRKQRARVQHETVSPMDGHVQHPPQSQPTTPPAVSSQHRPKQPDLSPPQPPSQQHSVSEDFDDPDVNQDWVKGFERRVLRPSSSYVDRIKRNDVATPLHTTTLPPSTDASSPIPTDEQQQNPSESISGRDKAINWAIGVSLASWYVTGEEGLRSIWTSLFS